VSPWKRAIFLAALVFVVWVAVDLGWPFRFHLRHFDSQEVAHLETAMWRAYYEHHPFEMFRLLTTLLRRQYGMPFWRSCLSAGFAARAAVTFQKGKSHAQYEQALPDLRRFYAQIRRGSDVPFDPAEAARRELEWWIAHRERRQDLVKTLSEIQAAIYGPPDDRFTVHAQLRAQAMLYRDQRGESITDQDWHRIENWLRQSWASLHTAVAQ
jgi:hypothetical protein